ncbi:MAG: hypothetical protein OHK0052_10590 [Anaerolineales bacterium]
MRRFDVLLFDLGNTLLYFDGIWSEIFAEGVRGMLAILRTEGIALTEDAFAPKFRACLNEYYLQRDTEFVEYTTLWVLNNLLIELGYPNTPPQVQRAALNALYAVSQTHWLREDDAIPTLQTLQQHGYRLGLISNAGDAHDLNALIDQHNLRDFFEVIFISAEVGIRKPNPKIFKMALQAMGNPERARVAMIGDTLGADILGAHNAGIFSIWITRRADTPQNREHIQHIQPHLTIETLAELPQRLNRLP